MRRSRRDLNKLGGKTWLRVNMIEVQNFSEEFTYRFLGMAGIEKIKEVWLDFQHARNIKNREAYLIRRLKEHIREKD